MYLSYISGVSLSELKDTNTSDKKHLLTQSFFFVMGLSFVFLVIGYSASFFGKFMFEFQRILQILGGLLLFLMGLHLMGVLKLDILNIEKKLKIKKQDAKSFNSFFIGLTFGAGWTPCIGPVLASVFALGAIYPENMLIFILIFILGFSIPLWYYLYSYRT